jgi:tight adherence protein B
MRRLVAALLVLTGLAAASAAPAVAAPQLSEARSLRFPSRSWVLSLPQSTSLKTSDVDVRENGRGVEDLEVVAGDEAGRRSFGVVLAIDASDSMAGDAIAGAVRAARTFVEQRAPNQSVGLLLFNSRITPLLQPTASGPAIDRALARAPQLQQGTHIYDAGIAAIGMLRKARIQAGSVVILSDGDDVGSRAGVDQLVAAATKQRVRIYTVGLRSGAFQPATLQQIASGALGQYSEATSSAQLERIYQQLGQQFASQYLLTYKSLAPLASLVDLEVRVRGSAGAATASYTTPPLPPAAPSVEPASGPGTLGLVVVALLVATLLGVAVFLVVRRRPATLRQRVSAYGMPLHGEEALALRDRHHHHPGPSIGDLVERPLRHARWWPRFELMVELSGVPATPGQVIGATAVATVALVWLVGVVAERAVAGVLVAFLPVAVYLWIATLADRSRRRFADELADNLQVVASAIRAGHSFTGGLAVAAEEAAEPAKSEFERIVRDDRLGVPLTDSMAAVAERMRSRELEHVAVVVEIQREVGGNTAQVLDQVADTIRYRAELRRLVSSLTAQGRLAGLVVTSLPVAMGLFLAIVSPGYLTPLVESTAGVLILVVSGFMVGIGWLIIRRIVDVKV